MSETAVIYPTATPSTAAPDSEAKPKILLSIKQAMQYRSEIENKMCRWVITMDHEKCQYAKNPLGTGCTTDISDAHELAVKTILDKYSKDLLLIDMLDQVEAERISKLPFKHCVLEEVLPRTMVDAIKLQPANPVYRGILMARLGKMPPDSITEFEKLREWIELNCDPKGNVAEESEQPQPAPRTADFEVQLNYAEIATGTCRFTVQETGSGTVRISENDIRYMAEGAEDLDALVESVEESVSNDRPDIPDMETDYDSYGYSHHEVTDRENFDWSYADTERRRREALVTYLRRILSREQLERLGITDEE